MFGHTGTDILIPSQIRTDGTSHRVHHLQHADRAKKKCIKGYFKRQPALESLICCLISILIKSA